MENFDLMVLIKHIIIGLIQGFTEPIPVSSSGHVMIASELLGMGEQGFTFAILTNTASLIAICIIFREDIARLIFHSLQYLKTREKRYLADFKFAMFVIVGTIPAGVLGVLLSDVIAENTSMTTIAITLFVTGIALWLIRNLRGTKRDGDLKLKDAIIVGFGQAVALMPGISRSGATIISSMAVGMKQDTALRFSFMLYIPISLGGVVLGVKDFIEHPAEQSLIIPYIATFIATMVMTYFAMRWFMGVMKNGKLVYFSYYCFIVGTLLLIFY
ncbi:undecaprenyl-diphosphate phosphatase [Metasolibacillus meyeri]|uniref:undecaprenyl-diphosphate phosphatase n=1 Tax=Metasolibacillus meyeri TaxID=1071052 RepID=UPI000D2F9756|nr:undecaprenyl-diphosphate phosphatase [Metasolibacillus meyeri]